jgi:hypothetical protein
MQWVSLTELLGMAERHELAIGFVLAGAGLIYMILGARAARLFTVISYVVLGMVVGSWLPVETVWQWAAGILAAVGLGWFSRSFHQLSVGLLAGAWAGWCVVNATFYVELPGPVAWSLGGAVFAGTISLAYVSLREVTAAVLSFQGAMSLLAGLLILISAHVQLWRYLNVIFVKYPPYLAFLLLAGTMIGFYVQIAEERREEYGSAT